MSWCGCRITSTPIPDPAIVLGRTLTAGEHEAIRREQLASPLNLRQAIAYCPTHAAAPALAAALRKWVNHYSYHGETCHGCREHGQEARALLATLPTPEQEETR